MAGVGGVRSFSLFPLCSLFSLFALFPQGSGGWKQGTTVSPETAQNVIERLPSPEVRALEASAEFVVTFDPVRDMEIGPLLAAVRNGSLQGENIEVLQEQPAAWRCSCGQERVEAVLASLPVEEITAMLKEDGKAEVICHFCNIAYQVGPERLEQMVVSRTPTDVH